MRLFIALDLPDDLRDALAALQTRLPNGARPVPEENLHLTLAFLGDQPDKAIEAIHDGLETIRAPAPSLMLGGASLFGGRRGQALALAADGGPPLRELHDRVMSRLRGAGVQPDRRRFRPHVTLARLSGGRDPAPALAALTGITLGPSKPHGFSLVQSTLHPDGALHETLATYPLA